MSEMIPLAARLDLARQLADAHLKFLTTYDHLIRPVSQALGSNTADPHAEPTSEQEAWACTGYTTKSAESPPAGWKDATLEEAAEDVGLSREDVATLRAAGMGDDGIIRPVEPTTSAAQAEPTSEQPASQTQAEEPKKRRGRPRKDTKEEAVEAAAQATPQPAPAAEELDEFGLPVEATAKPAFNPDDVDPDILAAMKENGALEEVENPASPEFEQTVEATADANDAIAASEPPPATLTPPPAGGYPTVIDIRTALQAHKKLIGTERSREFLTRLRAKHGFDQLSELEEVEGQRRHKIMLDVQNEIMVVEDELVFA